MYAIKVTLRSPGSTHASTVIVRKHRDPLNPGNVMPPESVPTGSWARFTRVNVHESKRVNVAQPR